MQRMILHDASLRIYFASNYCRMDCADIASRDWSFVTVHMLHTTRLRDFATTATEMLHLRELSAARQSQRITPAISHSTLVDGTIANARGERSQVRTPPCGSRILEGRVRNRPGACKARLPGSSPPFTQVEGRVLCASRFPSMASAAPVVPVVPVWALVPVAPLARLRQPRAAGREPVCRGGRPWSRA